MKKRYIFGALASIFLIAVAITSFKAQMLDFTGDIINHSTPSSSLNTPINN